ncbi:hypothetical protein [Zooshikella sp. RANM57]|uniref:hypothetical protein n=1 Tax=Zooshikella sp. RANM57 TaxID=3425863 RepID=UPI003D6FA2BE
MSCLVGGLVHEIQFGLCTDGHQPVCVAACCAAGLSRSDTPKREHQLACGF